MVRVIEYINKIRHMRDIIIIIIIIVIIIIIMDLI